MAISTNGTVLTRLAGALYNTQMSNATYAEVAALDPATLANTLYARDFSTSTDLAVATTLVTNLGLSTVAGLSNWVAAQLTAAGSAKGAKVVDLLNSFAQMTADATYGTAATAFNTKVDAALALSQTAGNKGGTFEAAGVVVVANATFALTTGIDTGAAFTGGSGNDSFNATHLTLNASDVLVGGAGTDTLTIVDTGSAGLTVPAASVSGIENITIRNLNTTAAVAGVTPVSEQAAFTFRDLAAGQAVSIAGVTFTAGTSGATAANVAAAFTTGTISATTAAVTGGVLTPTGGAAGDADTRAKVDALLLAGGYTAAASTATVNTVNFTASGTAGPVIDLAATGTAVTGSPQVTTLTITNAATGADNNTTTFTYNGIGLTAAAGATDATAAFATNIAAAINAYAGKTIAVAGATTVVITADTAVQLAGFASTGNTFAYALTTPLLTPAAPTVAIRQGVANVDATAAATATDSITATNFVGATAFTSESSSGLLALSGLSATQTANLIGGTGGITAGYGATVAAGTVNVSGGTTAGAVAVNGAALKTLNISSSGATNTLGAISSDSAVVSAVNLTADAAILTTGLTVANAGAVPAVALNISGATGDRSASSSSAARSSVTLGTLDADFTSINAGGLTAGGVSATLSATTTATFTGGAGSDRITTSTSGQLGAVNAGAGTDTLTLADTTHMDTAAEGAIYTGFEVLGVANNVSIDMDTFTGSTITAIAIADATNATSVTDMSATQAASVTITAGAGALTLGVKDATTVGTNNVLNITVSDGDTTSSEAVWGTGDVTLAGVETINITATDDVTLATMANISGLGTLTVTGAGDVSLTTNTMALTNNTSINASAVTGTVVINAGAATGFGAAITGSATNTNTLTGTVAADVITGGSNVDTIYNRATGGSATAGDIIVTGAGFDTVTLIGAVAAATSTNYDAATRITDFTVGTAANNTDLIRFVEANTDYLEVGAAEGLAVVGTKEGASGAVGVQNVAQNAGAAAGATGAEFIKLTTGVAFTTDIQTTFNLAIGTSTVTTLTGDSVFAVSYYDTTNSRMVILGVDITAGTATVLESADVVTLIGTINMTAADYALIDTDNFAGFLA